jgi:hypothetical protein
LTFESDRDGDRRRKSEHPSQAEALNSGKTSRKKRENPEIGSALRSIYQRTIDENIPPEMLDLLGKLG